MERYHLNDDVILGALLDELYSSIGSLSNMKNLSNAVSGIENIIYNELIVRGYSVDVGVVAVNKVTNNKKSQSLHEIDFVVNKGAQKVYIQSALSLDTPEKKEQELSDCLIF